MRLGERIHAAWNALLDRPPTKQQVMRCAHDLGMHNAVLEPDCDLCFERHFNGYMDICTEALVATGRTDECLSFRAYVRRLAWDNNAGRMLMLHENPAYMIADYLRIVDGPELDELVKVAADIMSKKLAAATTE